MWIEILFIVTILNLTIDAKTAVLILARGGSKGVYLKNLRNVSGISLLSRAIRTAKEAGLNDVTVSTDHPLIALQAIRDNATVFRRSHVTSTNWAPSIWGVAEVLSVRQDITILILMQATSPFTKPSHLQNAIKRIDYPRAYDCVFSATRSFKLRWILIKDKLYPANFNLDARVRRQDWHGELLETGAFYITRRELLEQAIFQNNNCTVFEVSALESLEIDALEDLELANIIVSANLL